MVGFGLAGSSRISLINIVDKKLNLFQKPYWKEVSFLLYIAVYESHIRLWNNLSTTIPLLKVQNMVFRRYLSALSSKRVAHPQQNTAFQRNKVIKFHICERVSCRIAAVFYVLSPKVHQRSKSCQIRHIIALLHIFAAVSGAALLAIFLYI